MELPGFFHLQLGGAQGCFHRSCTQKEKFESEAEEEARLDVFCALAAFYQGHDNVVDRVVGAAFYEHDVVGSLRLVEVVEELIRACSERDER